MNFRLKTIIGIALIEIVLLVLLVFSALNFLADSNERQLQQHARITSQLFAHAIKDAVLAYDLATLESFTEAILTEKDVVYVRILSNGIPLSEGGAEQPLQQIRRIDSSLEDVDDGIFDVVAHISESDIQFGEIHMGLSISDFEQVYANARRWTIGIAGLEVLLVAFFSFVLGTYLTRQLQRLKVGTEVIERSGPGHQIPVSGNDDLAEVARAFNTMSLSLRNSYAELQTSLEMQNKLLLNANHNEAKTQAILSSSLDALITIDLDGQVLDFNKAAEATFGWQRDEIVGSLMAEFIIPPALRERHRKGMQHYRDSGEGPTLNRRLELPALHKDGHEFPIEISISPVETDEGTLFTAFVRDISARQAAQTELRLAAKAFETSEAMFIVNANIEIIRTNAAFTRITGYIEEEVLGLNPKQVLKSGLHDKMFYRDMWSHIVNDGEWAGEIYNKRKNGEVFPEYLSISAVSDEDGEVTHYIAHVVDISEQKANEKRLRRAHAQAEAANVAKGRFLAIMSHEIRTPLNAILGVFDLLKETRLNDGQQDLVDTGHSSGSQLLSIINDILDFSKMEAGKLELKRAAFDLHSLLNTAVEMLQTQAMMKGLALSLFMDHDFPRYAESDPGRLRQILINLVNNAIKFTPSGHIIVRASASRDVGDDFTLHCEVEDSGIGISPEFRDLLFDEFTMADGTHARTQQGSGLGLAICKQLVKLMGGDIGVRSDPGQGSVFTFDIPMRSADHAENELDPGHAPVRDLPIQPVRILLAEDNAANQMIIRSILAHSGITLAAVSNGREAVAAVQESDFDLVLMDISMPVMDGIAATQAIRQLPPPVGRIPVVALTAHAMDSDKERFLQAGMDAHLSKPINRHAVFGCIRQYVSKSLGAPPQMQRDATLSPASPQDAPVADDQNPTPLVDDAVLEQLTKDTSPAIVPDLLLHYVDDARRLLDNICQATACSDMEQLQFHSHTLGSSSAAHGNARLYEVARAVEGHCRAGDPAQAFNMTSTLVSTGEASFVALIATAKRLAQANED